MKICSRIRQAAKKQDVIGARHYRDNKRMIGVEFNFFRRYERISGTVLHQNHCCTVYIYIQHIFLCNNIYSIFYHGYR